MLPLRPEAVDVAVMQPENRVQTGSLKQPHIAADRTVNRAVRRSVDVAAERIEPGWTRYYRREPDGGRRKLCGSGVEGRIAGAVE